MLKTWFHNILNLTLIAALVVAYPAGEASADVGPAEEMAEEAISFEGSSDPGTEPIDAPVEEIVVFSDEPGDGTGDRKIRVKLLMDLEAEYDSNVFVYSEDDRDSFDAGGALANTKFKNVNKLGDWIFKPRFGVSLSSELIPGQLTTLTSKVRLNRFNENRIKNYEVYTTEIKQNLTENDIVKFRYSFIPEFLVRDIFDTDTGGYNLADFEKNTFTYSYWRRVNDWLRARIFYRNADKDYRSEFDERDSLEQSVNLALIFPRVAFLEQWLPGTKATVFYEFTRQDSKGDDADSALDNDLSYDQNSVGVAFNVNPLPKLYIKPFYSFEFRDYTTGQTAAEDPLHSGREDSRFSVGTKVEYRVNSRAEVFVRYEYLESNPDTQVEPADTTADDVLGYKQHLVSFGTNWTF